MTHAAVFVAEQYLPWQESILKALKARFDPASRKFAADVFAAVIEQVRADNTAGDRNDKQLKQQCMPFAKFKMDEAASAGAAVSGAGGPSWLCGGGPWGLALSVEWSGLWFAVCRV